MRVETIQDIAAGQEIGTKYDEAAHRIWRNREILAPLLKYSVEELGDLTAEEIMGLIDADSITDGRPVSDLPPTISEEATALKSTTEKPITFDLRFRVKNPGLSRGSVIVAIHVDLEFQNKYRPTLRDGRSYPIVSRGIYYCAREISEQLGRITEQTNYGDIEKVVSIWVINDGVPRGLRGTASRYRVAKEDFIGRADEPAAEYDLMEVVLIRRGDEAGRELTEPLFQYLRSVYDADIEGIDRFTPASGNAKLKKEVEEMPGMSQVIYDKGLEQGREQGREQGILSLVAMGDISVEVAAARLDKEPDEVQRMLNEAVAASAEGERNR